MGSDSNIGIEIQATGFGDITLSTIGEIYLNSIDKDGTGFGYDFETIHKVIDFINVPLIIAGGAGNESHLIDGLEINYVNAVATANLFNFVGDGLINARIKMIEKGQNIVNWNN